MMKIFIHCFFVLFFFWPVSLLGKEPEKEEKIEVKAPAPAGGEKADSSSFFTSMDLSREFARIQSLPELLSRKEGISIRNFGGLGKLSTISIRGSTSQQVSVYLDGFQLNTTQNGSVDFSNIPLAGMERVDILRGGDSARFGSGAIGGAVHLTSAALLEKERTLFSFSYGSFNTAQIQFSRVSQWGKLFQYLIALDLFHTRGNFPFSPEGVKIGGTSLSTGPRQERENNRSDLGSLLFKVGQKTSSSFSWFLLEEIFLSQKGIPGTEALPLPKASQEDFRNLTGLQGKWQQGDCTITGKVFFRANGLHFSDPQPSLGLPIRTSNRNYSYGGEILGKYFLTTDFLEHGLLGSLSLQQNVLESSDLKAPQRNILRLFFQDEMVVGEDLFILSPAIAYERASDAGDQISSKIGFKILWGKMDKNVYFQSNIRQVFRFPEFNELYYPNLGFARGNPDLKPEKGLAFDAGMGARYKNFKGEVVFFYQELENSIVWVNLSPFTIAPVNTDRLFSRGIEASLSVHFEKNFSLVAGYTYLDSQVQKTGLPLPGRASHGLRIKAEGTWESWTLFGEIHYSSRVPLNLENTTLLEESFQINGGLSYAFSKEGQITFEIKNALDASLRDARGFPLPGRSFFVKIAFQF